MMKSGISVLTVFLILAVSVLAGNSELFTRSVDGSNSYDMQDPRGFFPSLDGGVLLSTGGKAVSYGYGVTGNLLTSPLVADLNGDGTPEIIVQDSYLIKALNFDYTTNTLSKVGAWDFGEEINKFFVVDWTGDGDEEVLVIHGGGTAELIDYNGTDFFNDLMSIDDIYNSNDEYDGSYNGAKMFFGHFSGQMILESGAYFSASHDGEITSAEMNVKSIVGTPYNSHLRYSFYACKTSLSEFDVSKNFSEHCSGSPSLLSFNVSVSDLLGNSTGIKVFDFNNSFSVNSGDDVILFSELESSDAVGSDAYWSFDTDTSASNKRIMQILNSTVYSSAEMPFLVVGEGFSSEETGVSDSITCGTHELGYTVCGMWKQLGSFIQFQTLSFSDGLSGWNTIDNFPSGFATGYACPPRINDISYIDVMKTDGSAGLDGSKEWVFSFMTVISRFGTTYYDIYINVDVVNEYGNASISQLDLRIKSSYNIGWDQSPSWDVCSQGFDRSSDDEVLPKTYLSSPIIKEFDDVTNNGKEIGIAFSDGFSVPMSNFLLRVYKPSDFSLVGMYPEISNIEGQILSNPFSLNCFSDSPSDADIGVFSYDRDRLELGLLCGSEQRSSFGSLAGIEFQNLDADNITLSEGGETVYSCEMDGDGTSELMTSFGIIDVDAGSLWGSMDKIYSTGLIPSVSFPNDYGGIGRADMIVMTESGVFFVEDGTSNSQAFLKKSAVAIDPCVSAEWITNTSVNIRVIASDDDGDLVQARAFLYYGESFSQNESWSPAVASETPITFTGFKGNVTGNNYVLRVEVKDDREEHELNPTVLEQLFSVGDGGTVTLGSCQTVVGGVGVPSEELSEAEEAQITAEEKESFEDDLKSVVKDLTGSDYLSRVFGLNLLFLLLIISAVIAVYIKTGSEAVTGGVAVLIAIVGYSIEIVSTLALTVIVIALVSLAFIFYNKNRL